MLKKAIWRFALAAVVMGSFAPYVHAQSASGSTPPTVVTGGDPEPTSPNVVTGGDPEPTSPNVVDVLVIMMTMIVS